jgi:trans-aconitate 2-methyltransferase
MPAREWDGATYDRISTPQESWGRAVLDRLGLNGDEVALDAGCGSGRVTQMLAERVPNGRVIAVDASVSMAQAARERLGPEADVRVMDLLDLELREPVDAVLSTATFHWIADHERLFARLHAALRPGGQLVAQCGGKGNIDRVRGAAAPLLAREPYAAHFVGWRTPWNYASPEDTRARLLAAGFSAAQCWLTPAPVTPPEPRVFIGSVIFGPHLDRLPAQLHEPFLDDVLAAVGEPVVIDYVRLNIDAVA